MKKKTKYITAAIVFVLLSLCNIFVSAILHKMLIKDLHHSLKRASLYLVIWEQEVYS